MPQTGYRTQTLLAVPLHNLDGAVSASAKRPTNAAEVFTDDDAEILATLAAHLADLFENSPIGAELKAHRISMSAPASQMINGFSTQNIVGMSHRTARSSGSSIRFGPPPSMCLSKEKAARARN